MASLPLALALPTTYPVWVFLLGPVSGPQRMLVRAEDDGQIGIKTDQTIFPPATNIKSVDLTVDQKLYHVYFDLAKHESIRTQASYIFLRLQNTDFAIDIIIEDDLPSIIDCLTT